MLRTAQRPSPWRRVARRCWWPLSTVVALACGWVPLMQWARQGCAGAAVVLTSLQALAAVSVLSALWRCGPARRAGACGETAEREPRAQDVPGRDQRDGTRDAA